MAKKVLPKPARELFDSDSGRVRADVNFAQGNSAKLKTEIGFIREAFPLRSKDDVSLVLQSCDHNVEAAIACFANGEADNVLKQWNVQGKKSKNGSSSKKKRNKKKQAKTSQPDPADVDVLSQTSDDISKLNNDKGLILVSEKSAIESTPVKSLECPSELPALMLLHPPSPSDSEGSLPSPSSDLASDATPEPDLQDKHLPSSFSPVKFERMSSGPDALKKTVKDLQRSSVSLARFQLLLEEECDKSFKVITKTFEELRQSLKDREAHLCSQMEEFKKHAVDLLEQRQENAAALKLKSDRVGGMQATEVVQLRNEIKNFVTERKIDEELARTTRFVGDKEKLLSTINNFGEVVPIKNCYSPVTLNPPPLPMKKVEKSPPKKTPPDTSAPPKPATISTAITITVPTITVPMNNSLSSHEALQEVAEMHARLQAVLHQQGLSVAAGKQHEGQKQTKPEPKKDRPTTAPHKPSQRQTSSQRPHTALPHNEQQKKDPKSQPQKPRQNQQNRQQGNQVTRDSRRSNQRRPPQRDPGSNVSNGKKEAPKEGPRTPRNPSETQQARKSDKGQQSQKSGNDVEGAQSRQPGRGRDSSQAANRNEQPREQRESGNERTRNRRGRRRGGKGAFEEKSTANQRNPSKRPLERQENGPQEKRDRGPQESHENSPQGRHENGPQENGLENGPHERQVNDPQEKHVNGPQEKHDSVPQERHENGPPERHLNGPQEKHGSVPPKGQENAPPEKDDSGPQERRENGPQDIHENGPQETHVNGPQEKHDSGPHERRENGPQDRHENDPQDRHENGPQETHVNHPQQKHDSGPQKGHENAPPEKDDSDPPKGQDNSPQERHDNGPTNGEGDSAIKEGSETTIKEADNPSDSAKENGSDDCGKASQGKAKDSQNTQQEKENPSESCNSTNTKVPEKERIVPNDGLPQRPDRSSRRRGAQRDIKDEAVREPSANGDLHVIKPAVNGIAGHHDEEPNLTTSEVEKSKEDASDNKPLVESTSVEDETESSSVQEMDLDKASSPLVNGYIPVKESKEVFTIDR